MVDISKKQINDNRRSKLLKFNKKPNQSAKHYKRLTLSIVNFQIILALVIIINIKVEQMQTQLQCENCQMIFDNPQSLQRHQRQFCINSNYGNLDSLTKQFESIGQGKDISLYGRQPIVEKGLKYDINNSRIENNSNFDKEYRTLLKQIGEREILRGQLDREKRNAEDQLMQLQKKQKELMVDVRRKDLQDVLKKREQLAQQEQQLQREIKNFQKQKKEQNRLKTQEPDQDFVFREGRQAGKLAMQRRLLEQKKRQIQNNLKLKKREQQRVNRELNNVKQQPIYIPEFKKKESVAQPRIVKPIQNPSFQRNQPQPKPMKKESTQINYQPPQKVKVKTYQKPQQIKLNQSNSKRSNVSSIPDSLDNCEYLHASRFAGNQKTLFECLNPKGKSDQDIFIQSLVAQQYDALNLIARLPKDSQIYQTKLKQFQQMSKIRQQLKEKIQKVRLDKVKRQFKMEKQMTETQKSNLEWLDKNRKDMLTKQVHILHNQHVQKIQNDQKAKNGEQFYPPQSPNSQGRIPSIISNQKLPSITNIPIRPNSTGSGLKGYKMVVKSIKGYENKGPLSVRLVVQQQGFKGAQWSFMTKYHDVYAPKDERNPFNPLSKNRLDESGNVIFNETFQIREDMQGMYNSNQAQIYLWIILMEKEEQKMSNQPQVYIWYCFKLTHFGQLREGTFTLNLYHDNITYPNPTDMNKLRGKAKEEVVIQLNQAFITDASPEPLPTPIVKPNIKPTASITAPKGSIKNSLPSESVVSIGRNLSKQSSKRGRNFKVKATNKDIDALQNINEQFFLQNQNTSDFQIVNRQDPLNFNFSIVGLRTLPSYIGPVKLQMSFITSQGDKLIDSDQFLVQIGPNMYNPMVNFTKRIRNLQMLSSTVVQVRMIGLSTLNYQPGLFGFTQFHLFYNAQGEVFETDDADKYFLINGYYQIPIYWGLPKGYLSESKLNQIHPKIPCATMLIAINLPSQQNQIFPQYSQGVYNTIFYQINVIQYRLFQQQNKRQILQTQDYVDGYFKFKGMTKFKPQQLTKLLSQGLAFNQQNLSNLLMLNSMAEYNPSFGIVVMIDSMTVPASKDQYYYFCTICLSPPANYYKQTQNDLQFLYKIDLAASFTQDLILRDQPINFSPIYNQNMALIIQLCKIKLSTSNQPVQDIQVCGHTVVALFDLEQTIPCANVGIQQIKLEDGQFNQRDLKQLQSNAKGYIEQISGTKKSDYKITLRILNGFFPDQLPGPIIGNQGKPLRSIFQNSKGFQNTQDSVRKVIQNFHNIKLQ